MITRGSLILRYAPHFGWQVFQWLPGYPELICTPRCKIIRDVHDGASLLRITASFTKEFRRGEFIKRPDKYVCWSPIHPAAGYLLPHVFAPTKDINAWLQEMLDQLKPDYSEKATDDFEHELSEIYKLTGIPICLA